MQTPDGESSELKRNWIRGIRADSGDIDGLDIAFRR